MLQYLVAELSRDPIVSPLVMQQVVDSATAAVDAASEALHSYVPAFQNEMSTSILSGNLWIHEAVTHQNLRYMPELFGIDLCPSSSASLQLGFRSWYTIWD